MSLPLDASTVLPAKDLPPETVCVECGHVKAHHFERPQLTGRLPNQLVGTFTVDPGVTYCGHTDVTSPLPRCPCPGFR